MKLCHHSWPHYVSLSLQYRVRDFQLFAIHKLGTQDIGSDLFGGIIVNDGVYLVEGICSHYIVMEPVQNQKSYFDEDFLTLQKKGSQNEKLSLGLYTAGKKCNKPLKRNQI